MTYLIIAITVLLSFYAFKNNAVFYKMQFNAYHIFHNKRYEKMLGHLFIHADWGHLFVNMFSFYFFGRIIEYEFSNHFGALGSVHYILFYLGAGVVSSIPSLLKYKDNINYNAVGASGAVSAIIYAFIILHPFEMIYVFFVPMPAIIYGFVFLGYSYYMAKKNVDNIGHDAHFWGAVFGIAYPLLFISGSFSSFINQLF